MPTRHRTNLLTGRHSAPWFVITLLLLFISSKLIAQEVTSLKVIKGEGQQQESTAYFHRLLAQALATTQEQYGAFRLETVPFRFSQNRTLKLLNEPGVLDVTYSMTSPSREANFIPIKVPLLNGLFGKRRMLVRAEDKAEFEAISETELKRKVACQGLHWPDYRILKSNGFAVYGVIHFEQNVQMLLKGRCDYFPRGIHEVQGDWEKFHSADTPLAIVDNLMFRYNANIYFFVGQHHDQLAQRLTEGLKKLQTQGILGDMLRQTQHFHYDPNVEQNPNLRIIWLDN